MVAFKSGVLPRFLSELVDLPGATHLRRSTSVALAHGASGGGEGSSEGTEAGRLGEGCAEHDWEEENWVALRWLEVGRFGLGGER